ncbi:MAG: aspartate dehydrogenase [Proteobacteria bacterium]|nr:aspartate dehydrogenase [Pseudomonadota bacterium]MBI3496207.1 aspartate dehydrogenase [Pseudomonadota bacterium]
MKASFRKVAIAGFGAIGREVARRLDAGIPGFELVAVAARDVAKAARNAATLRRPPRIEPLAALPELADVIIECVPAAAFVEAVGPALDLGRIVLTVSAAALLDHPEMVDRAAKSGGRLILATGALLGLDAVRAAAIGTISSVRMVTAKPPRSLAGAPYLKQQGIDVSQLTQPLRVFAGTAREGARAFPANVNVAAALALAGIGPDRTQLEVWADPALTRNTHRIEVEADSARFSMAIENVPSEDNPGTGKITALSLIAALRDLAAPLRIGT